MITFGAGFNNVFSSCIRQNKAGVWAGQSSSPPSADLWKACFGRAPSISCPPRSGEMQACLAVLKTELRMGSRIHPLREKDMTNLTVSTNLWSIDICIQTVTVQFTTKKLQKLEFFEPQIFIPNLICGLDFSPLDPLLIACQPRRVLKICLRSIKIDASFLIFANLHITWWT